MFLWVFPLAETVSYGRTINVAEGSRINIYILLDTSGSINEKEFFAARNATEALIKKVISLYAFNWSLSIYLGTFRPLMDHYNRVSFSIAGVQRCCAHEMFVQSFLRVTDSS